MLIIFLIAFIVIKKRDIKIEKRREEMREERYIKETEHKNKIYNLQIEEYELTLERLRLYNEKLKKEL